MTQPHDVAAIAARLSEWHPADRPMLVVFAVAILIVLVLL